MKKSMVGNLPGSVLGMMADLAHKLQHGQITPDQLAKFLKKKNPFEKDVSHFTGEFQLADWQKFYANIFGLTLDLSGVKIPEPRDGFCWMIVVVPGITIERVLAECKNRFAVWRWTNDDLDKITESTRSATTQPYAVWVRPRVEADEEHANKSYNDLQKANIIGITLLERLLLELKYFTETGGHLDARNITLCSGSLCGGWVDRNVPSVIWSGGKLYVDWDNRYDASSHLRSREVVI